MEGESDSDEDFGQKLPPLSVAIAQLLRRYPDGQIFKEMIQNADDAGAKTIRFYVDHREHATRRLLHVKLKDYQGPSLISYNDAQFSRKDWHGIQSIQQSVKADDPFKLGQFGIGFNSVYHVTDLPMVISGDKVAFFEPQMRVWRGKSGISKSLSKMQQECPDHLSPFHGIAGFKSRGVAMASYPHTLFRFPLRRTGSQSGLSSKCYDVAKLLTLIDALKEEANVLLLFLRSIERVEIFEIRNTGKRQLFKVEIERDSCSRLREERSRLRDRLTESFSAKRCYGISNPISFTANFVVTVTDGSLSEDSHWLVSNLVGSADRSVIAAANREHIFPWVGTALQFGSTEFKGGRIFCVLPMPSETVSELPVHVNGTFGLNDDRRSLKWPGRERKNDGTAEWNKLLVEKVIPKSYVMLLKEALRRLSGGNFYDIIPDICRVTGTNWEGLLNPVCSALLCTDCKCLWSLSKKWVNKERATFIEEDDDDVGRTVQEVLSACGYDVVCLPDNMWRALELVADTDSLKTVTPRLVREALRANGVRYKNKNYDEKLELLEYCLSDAEFSDLHDIHLLPLANSKFAYFEVTSSPFGSDCSYYVCSDDFPQELLPNAEQHLVNLPNNPFLHSKLKKVAASKQTDLTMLDAGGVASLLSSVFPRDWDDETEIFTHHFPLSWFKTFWKWVRKHSLELFVDKFIIPIVHEDSDFSIMKLKTDSNIVYVSRPETLTTDMENVLTKLSIRYTTYQYLQHPQLSFYLNSFSSSGVLKATAKANSYVSLIRSASFSREEAEEFQSFLVSQRPINLSQHQSVLQNLGILLPVGDSAPVSSKGAKQEGNRVVVKPSLFHLHHTHLPSDLLILSQSDNEQRILKAIGSDIHFSSSTTDFILTHIFPQIGCGIFRPISSVSPLMVEILSIFTYLSNCSTRFAPTVASLKFLPYQPRRQKFLSPEELCDPSNAELRALYRGKNIFPLAPFTTSECLSPLRMCGLKVSVSAQELYDILCELAGNGSLVDAGDVGFSRAKAVFKYIQKHSTLLTNTVTTTTWYSSNLKDAICMLAREKSILPVESAPPDSCGYPKCLGWKGSSFTSHLAKMDSSVLPCSKHTVETLPKIVGSQVYVICCPSVLCSELRPSPPAQEVVNHLVEIIRCAHKFRNAELDEIIQQLYRYLSDNFIFLLKSPCSLYNNSWIWLKQHHKFVRPADAVLERHPDVYDLSPYLYVLPEAYSDFAALFTHFGVYETATDELLVSLLSRIEERDISDPEKAWAVVRRILNWVTVNGTKHADEITHSSRLYVPIESRSLHPELERVDNVVYLDMKCLKSCYTSRSGDLKFVHDEFLHLAPFLGVTPLSKELNISEDIMEDAGQNEPLHQRLKNILHDYQDGLTIIKELIQNADDAEASEVNICYDARHHCIAEDKLIFGGMAEAHGPALIFHNNKTFSDADFANIQKLAGATKRDQPLKIGKFGVGFCSVYHITDIPSFVSRDQLYIFDPTAEYLADEIKDRLKPGKKLCFTSEVFRYSEQMCPYVGLFGFESSTGYQGTMFRMPFRTHTSKLSDVKYAKKQVEQLLCDVEKSTPKLLLFLKNVNHLTFSQIGKGQSSPTKLLEVSKQSMSCPESKLVINSHPQSSEVTITVTNCRLGTITEQHWLIAESISENGNHVSATACLLEELLSSPGVYHPQPVTGEAFCFLPLHLQTGLPVHVSANFAVMNDRTGIHYSDLDNAYKSDQSKFNVSLMEECIPISYHKLLLDLKDLALQGRVAIDGDDYRYYSLWPIKESLKSHNPWDLFLPQLYELISGSELFYSKSLDEWQYLSDSSLLAQGILHPDQFEEIEKVIKMLGYPLIHLPTEYHTYLSESLLQENTIDESKFLDIFFRFITSIPTDIRNNILQSLIQTYAHRETDGHLREVITSNCCIPCTPHGKDLKACNNVVDPSSKPGSLYDPADGMFPIPCFLSSDLLRSTLKGLGMMTSSLPWRMIVERADNIEEVFYDVDREKALQRSKIVLYCMDKNMEMDTKTHAPPKLAKIRFLPVLQRPRSYPKELHWKGSGPGRHLLSGSELLANPKNAHLVGSVACITSSKLSENTREALKISSSPSSIDDVLKQLVHIVEVHNSLSSHSKSALPTTWIQKACEKIYKYFEDRLSSEQDDDCGHKLLERMSSAPGLVWTDREFVRPDNIASKWPHNGPHLYSEPQVLSGLTKLKSVLQIKEKFGKDQLLQALADIKQRSGKEKIYKNEEKMIPDIASALAKSLGDDDQLDDCYLPDDKLCMCKVQDLVLNDAPWCSKENKLHVIYHKIGPGVAKKLGVKEVRSRALDQYDTSFDYFDGSPFGQREELTHRIRDILGTYTHNETVLKELLQNADDAGASKLYFILDERMHEGKRIPSDRWKDLQGPALLVWNDRGFTEDDFKGIQMLGLGSKRSKSDSIGQYGIGFNVVYHLTDCPSFLTNGNTLCILDPHLRYIPGADLAKPGRRLDNVDKKFWSNLSDLKSPYLYQDVGNCPDEIRKGGGTLFRFPLRWNEELVAKSELVDQEDEQSTQPLTAQMMEENLKEWAPKMKESLIFLNHVTELRFYVIREDGADMVTTHHFRAELSSQAEESRRDLQERNRKFSRMEEPFLTTYTLELLEEAPSRQKEEWIVQQGIGDVDNPSQNWDYLDRLHMTPVHGLAAKTKGGHFVPKVFCFLPLPLKSELPVHVNGKFILESSSRTTLWQSRDTGRADDCKKWNDRIIEALGSSYARFLFESRGKLLKSSYTNSKKLQHDIDEYYNLFPKWIADTDTTLTPVLLEEMMNLAQHTYRLLAQLKKEIIITVKRAQSHRACYHIDWQPVRNDDPSKQVYFWQPTQAPEQRADQPVSAEQEAARHTEQPDGEGQVYSTSFSHDESSKQVHFWKEGDDQKSIPPILKRLGIRLTVAPACIGKHFAFVGITIPKATPESVFEYYSSHVRREDFPCKIENTPFKDVESFKLFVQYVVMKSFVTKDERIYSFAEFISTPFHLPLLLTADNVLRIFDKENKVIACRYSKIFNRETYQHFLHPQMLDFKFQREYFVKPSPKSMELVSTILHKTLCPNLCCRRRKYASAFINIKDTLGPLWKCLRKDPVFKEHAKVIVQKWALILSSNDEVFQYDPDKLMPVTQPRSPIELSNGTKLFVSADDELNLEIFDIFKSIKMPTVNHQVVTEPKEFCPHFTEPESVLSNLCHLYDYLKESDSLSVFDKIYDHLAEIFTYFGRIHFQQSESCLKKIKCLPLFQNIDGRYRSLSDEVFFWPLHINMTGLNILLPHITATFLTEDGVWKKLATDADALGIRRIDPLTLYADHLFPYFYLLSEDECINQLLHIRDTKELFQHADINSKYYESDTELHTICVNFINRLKRLPVLLKNGKLERICQFCQPDNPVFKLFPENYTFLPEKLSSMEWVSFLEKIGLQMEPTKEEFVDFCSQVSRGHHGDIKKASDALLWLLFRLHEWHDDEDLLSLIKRIAFVCTDTVDELDWILPPSEVGVQWVQQKNVRLGLVPLMHCAAHKFATLEIAALVWTVLPVVRLPHIHHPPQLLSLTYRERMSREVNFLSHLDVCIQPSVSNVVKNICKIAQSRFSKFKLFVDYSQECIKKTDHVAKKHDHGSKREAGLVEIIAANIKYLDKLITPQEQFTVISELCNVPCVPVSSDNTTDSSKPVLVHPLQVVNKPLRDLDPSLHPFLCNLLPEMRHITTTFLSRGLGVNSDIQLDNIAYALEFIRSRAMMPLEPNTVKAVKTLLKTLHRHLTLTSRDVYKDCAHTLYLPGINRQKLFKSTDLIYNNKWSYKSEIFNFSAVPDHSVVSLLCMKHDEIAEYGFRMADFISKLPSPLTPMLLSNCCTERLHDSCQAQDTLSPFADKLKQSFQRKNFTELVEMILSTKSEKEVCKKFTSSLKLLLDSMEVVSVQNLKVDIIFERLSSSHNIGTAFVDFLLQKDHSGGYRLHVDSNSYPLRYKAFESLTQCITTEVYKISGVTPGSLKDVQESIQLIIQAETPEDVKSILTDLGINSSQVPLEEETMPNLTCKLGEPIPEAWHHRLHSDIDNVFKSQEVVGYEDTEDHFIFARVEYRVIKKPPGEEVRPERGEGEPTAQGSAEFAIHDEETLSELGSAQFRREPIKFCDGEPSRLSEEESAEFEGVCDEEPSTPSEQDSAEFESCDGELFTEKEIIDCSDSDEGPSYEQGSAVLEGDYEEPFSDLINTAENIPLLASPDEEQDDDSEIELDQYVITIKEDENESIQITVSILELHKIMWMKEADVNGSESMYDPNSEAISFWDLIKDETLKEMLRRIYKDLQRILKIRDKDQQRKARKAMYLKWHPDKNSHPSASQAFLYLQKQIQRIKDGDEIENPDDLMDEPIGGGNTFTDPMFDYWEEINRQRQQGMQRERAHRRESSGHDRQGGHFTHPTFTVVPDRNKAKIWFEQAKHDVWAMEVMFEAANREPTKKLYGHVCFLAHQVAEKTLKAGMYALNGLQPGSLRDHLLVCHASALAQDCDLPTECAELFEYENYYLRPRYPNRCAGQVPSNCFHLTHAQEAYETALKIYDAVFKQCGL